MAVNDEIFKNLEVYGGGTINERVYNFLGSLGYTGTINDRLGQFEEGGRKGWQGLIRAWGQWAPAQLFSQGQQGVWYEPKPIVAGQQVLYQDAAGTVPVEADGDPVGLMLDKSRGLVLGAEELENRDFSSWVSGSPVSWSIVNGDTSEVSEDADGIRVMSNSDTSRPAVRQSVSADKFFVCEVDVTVISGRFAYGAPPGNGGAIEIDASGVYKIRTKTSVDVIDFRALDPGSEAVVKSCSARELPGNHATQSTSAARPIYRTDGVLHWLEGDGVDDYMTLGDTLNLGTQGIIQVHAHNSSKTVLSGKSWAAAAGQRYFISADTAGNLLRGETEQDDFDIVQLAKADQKSVTSQRIIRGPGGFHEIRRDKEVAGTRAFTSAFNIQSAGRPFWIFAYPNSDSTAPLGGFVHNGAWYGAVIRLGGNSDQDISNAEDFVAKLAGITP